MLAYATSKGTVHALTRAMTLDCARDNVRINSLSPGAIKTPLLEVSAQRYVDQGEPRTLDQIMESSRSS